MTMSVWLRKPGQWVFTPDELRKPRVLHRESCSLLIMSHIKPPVKEIQCNDSTCSSEEAWSVSLDSSWAMKPSSLALSSSLLCCCRSSRSWRAAASIPTSDEVRQREHTSLQPATPLWEFTCHMGSHSVTCHPGEVTFLPLPEPIKAGIRFSDPKGDKAELT